MPFARPIAVAHVELHGTEADYEKLLLAMNAEGYVNFFQRGSVKKLLPRGEFFSYKHADKVMAMAAAKRAAGTTGQKHAIFLLIGEAKDCTDYNLEEEKNPPAAEPSPS